MKSVRHIIFWRTRDRETISSVCRFLNVPAFVSVNRTTEAGILTEEQQEALKPLADGGYIQIRAFAH